ncbi:Nucleolar protein 10 [Orchesella cincta]|uniref:Nucleolar protein 10 n=1 Tax=Orchesella cincta TaxID=48709 RepID=A0A1D2NCY1_ORCCI|nr:Nucleolar protein 10 [Orchesella cincta]
MSPCSTNEVKVYNLSAGKSLPDWLSEKKRRTLQKTDVDIRRRIELIQDFDMPGVSTNIQMSPDGEFILATGIYKPRIRCYDVKNLSMKFERCFDSEVVKFQILSPDYSKLVLLQCDRYIEFHSQNGRYFRLRIPKFGRDLAYHMPSCDIYVAGATSEVYRLNLELGRFMTPLQTEASCINKCVVNPVHQLMVFGTEEGKVEAWDPRTSQKVGSLDAAFDAFTDDTDVSGIPSVTSLAFKDGLTLGVGTATGQVMIYDIRSSKPLLVKDHYNSLPIKALEFFPSENMIFSMDEKIVKIWNQDSGEPFTSVEGEAKFNDICVVPNTGMFFLANEDKKMQTYYIPTLGPAPRWCSFLDNLTEELEESDVLAVYDDYKFVTEKELNEIGLSHLIGTNLLRAYMHGYFMDMRLFRKAKALVQPFQFEDFKKKKIKEKLQEERTSRLKLNTLPQVNRDLAIKLMSQPPKKYGSLADDDRFKKIFENPDYEIDKSADEFRLLNPVISKMDKKKSKKMEAMFSAVDEDDEVEGKGSSDEDDESSSDDDREWVKEVREERRKIQNEKWNRQRGDDAAATLQPKFYEIKGGEDFKVSDLNSSEKRKSSRISLGERLVTDDDSAIKTKGPLGNREMTFQLRSRKNKESFGEQAQKHHEERRKIRRSAGGLKNKRQAWRK